jgi:hypothetical protein
MSTLCAYADITLDLIKISNLTQYIQSTRGFSAVPSATIKQRSRCKKTRQKAFRRARRARRVKKMGRNELHPISHQKTKP